MQVIFLGSGAAFSPTAYNASILVDQTLLLDAGAPLCVHLPKVGVPLDRPTAVFISHFHADHCFNLALLIAARHELFPASPPLKILGPLGTLHAYKPEDRKVLDEATGNPFAAMITEMSLFSPAPSIYGGTDEVQRNIIGERVLGLPKEPSNDRVTPFRELPKNS